MCVEKIYFQLTEVTVTH